MLPIKYGQRLFLECLPNTKKLSILSVISLNLLQKSRPTLVQG